MDENTLDKVKSRAARYVNSFDLPERTSMGINYTLAQITTLQQAKHLVKVNAQKQFDHYDKWIASCATDLKKDLDALDKAKEAEQYGL